VKVPGYLGKVYTKAEYRGNSGPEVPWKVNFTYSEEGKGTIMYFYLSGPWYSKQSNVKAVKQHLTLEYQIVGRAIRPHPNKEAGWIVDLCGNLKTSLKGLYWKRDFDII
jgi:hypothetical protein